MTINEQLSFGTCIAERLRRSETKFNSFNLISAVVRGKLHETSHSRILGEILRYDRTILESFFDEFIGFELYGKEKNWDVLIEKDNIDVCIKGEKHAVIIENKVNNAPEQKDQIDRYVNHMVNECRGGVYVLYLTGKYSLLPSEYSFSKAKNRCTLIVKTYQKDVRKWVEEKLLKKDSSFSIHSALYHYKNYLDNMYRSDSEYGIPAEIKSDIELYLSQKFPGENEVSALAELSNKLIETAEFCKKLMREKKWDEIKTQINERLIQQDIPPLISMIEVIGWDLPDAGIEFWYKDRRYYAVVSYIRQRYIGIIDPDNNKGLDNSIVQDLKDLLAGMYTDTSLMEAKVYSTFRYPYWFNVDNNTELVDLYIKLTKILADNNLIKKHR